MSEALQLDISELTNLSAAARKLLNFAGATRVFLFDAPMGAGKTTFIKALCSQLGSTDHFSSPTYAILNEYVYPNGKIFHFDLYRLKSAEELWDLGVEELLDSGNYCFFEWPELVGDFLTTAYLHITIKNESGKRLVIAKRVSAG
jgi:tRNA threonylcarbamoyladenosine biosynthesis protein TsaE